MLLRGFIDACKAVVGGNIHSRCDAGFVLSSDSDSPLVTDKTVNFDILGGRPSFAGAQCFE